jgi:hypothetical protein
MLTLNGSALTEWQRCKRRYLLGKYWQPTRWVPKILFSKLLRDGIVQVSGGADPEHTGTTQAAKFLAEAANPGLQTQYDPFTLAHDYAASIKTILEYVSRRTPLRIQPCPAKALGSEVSWQFDAYQDDSGALHRWVVMDQYTQSDLARELHSWSVVGDIAVADAPLQLHIVVLGRVSGGHIQGDWCRTFRHPVIANRYKFQKTTGEGLRGEQWKAQFYQDMGRRQTAKAWVDMMEADNVEPILHRDVRQFSADQRDRIICDIEGLGWEIISSRIKSWAGAAMSRGSCDLPLCPWQDACYSSSDRQQDLVMLGYRSKAS